MSFSSTAAKSVSNSAGCASEIHTQLVTNAGWTLDDDQSSASPPYYVFKSTGEDGTAFPVYIQMRWNNSTNIIEFYQYMHWNNSTHTGTQRIGYSHSITTDDDAAFLMWFYATKDYFVLYTKVSTTYYRCGAILLKPFYKMRGVIQSSVSSGSSVVLTLDTGEASNFKVGRSCQVVGIGAGEGCEIVSIDSVNEGSNQVTVDSLARGLSANSVIGWFPRLWTMFFATEFEFLPPDGEGTSNFTTYGNHGASASFVTSGIASDNDITNMLELVPGYVYYSSGNNAVCGYFPKGLYFPHNISSSDTEGTVSVGDIDNGTATSATSTTLTDSSKSWTTDAYQDKCVIITSGTGVGQMRKISSNTATALTVPAWSTAPDSTSQYTICDSGARIFYYSSNYGYALTEIGDPTA